MRKLSEGKKCKIIHSKVYTYYDDMHKTFIAYHLLKFPNVIEKKVTNPGSSKSSLPVKGKQILFF